MGFDISYHPVDLELIQTRLLPYIQGEGEIDDLVERAVRLCQIRFRANQWGLGLMALEEQPERFHPELHVWGRPFFIEADSVQGISSAIDRYQALDGDDKAVDEVVRDMLESLEPGLAERAQPSTDGTLPSAEAVNRGIRWKVDLMRSALAAKRSGEEHVTAADGRVMDAQKLLSRSIPHVLLEFTSELRPGWMARGRVWPTLICSQANVELGSAMSRPRALVELVCQEVPESLENLEYTIVENYQVGALAGAEGVAEVRQRLNQGSEQILNSPQAEGEEQEYRLVLRKLDEALADAEYRNMGFCEASEIYSAPMGIMN